MSDRIFEPLNNGVVLRERGNSDGWIYVEDGRDVLPVVLQ